MAKPSQVSGLSARTPWTEAALLWIGARLADVRQHEGPARHLDPDAVHDMRVATRRLRGALELFDRRGTLEDVTGEVKALQDALGAVRDAQVQLAMLRERLGRARAAEQPVLKALVRAVSRSLEPKGKALKKALKAWDRRTAQGLLVSLDRLRSKGTLGGRRMHRRLARAMARLEARGEEALPGLDPRPSHRLRIAAKRLRYQLELLRPALAEDVPQMIEALTRLQDALGDLHDVDVEEERAAALAGEAPRLADSALALLARLKAERARRKAAAKREWERLRKLPARV